MTFSIGAIDNPIAWSEALKESARRFSVHAKFETSGLTTSTTFLRELLVSVTISDNRSPSEEELLSYKNRVRGFLVELARVMSSVAEQSNLDVAVASCQGEKRKTQLRSVRLATDEERRAKGITFVSEAIPLSGKELWEEFQASPDDRPRRVIISFREH